MAEKTYEYSPVTIAPGQTITPEPVQLWKQYLVGAVANIAVIAAGYVMVWTSPVTIILRDQNQTVLPKPITLDQEALVGSLLTVGAMCGPFVASPLATWLGRRWGLLLTSLPLLLGLILVSVANSVTYLYAGRIVWGLACGMIYTISPMYCAEIATVDRRGALGSFLQLFITLGFLVLYSIGSYISYNMIAYVGMSLVLAFVVCFFFMPETPKYLMMKDRREAAAASLMTLRGRSRAGVEDELSELAAEINSSADSKSASFGDVFRGGNLKALYIACVLLLFQQFSGVTAVLFYLSTIFEAAGTKLDPGTAVIIIGLVQFIASFFSSVAVERLGRKMLLLVSSSGTTIGLVALGIYFYFDSINSPWKTTLSFLPILSLIVYIVTYSFGLGPMPWTLLGELLPMEVKAIASPIATAFCWIMCFLVTRYFGPLGVAIGSHMVFWICAVFCALCFVFTLLVVPETKGKTALEIEDMLAGRKSRPRKHNNV